MRYRIMQTTRAEHDMIAGFALQQTVAGLSRKQTCARFDVGMTRSTY
jgi:hypothetical protein